MFCYGASKAATIPMRGNEEEVYAGPAGAGRPATIPMRGNETATVRRVVDLPRQEATIPMRGNELTAHDSRLVDGRAKGYDPHEG